VRLNVDANDGTLSIRVSCTDQRLTARGGDDWIREFFGVSSQGWGRRLTDPQRQRWNVAAQTVPTHPSRN
jgi:hypothetical protein